MTEKILQKKTDNAIEKTRDLRTAIPSVDIYGPEVAKPKKIEIRTA